MIYVFSGTGNTLTVAQHLATELNTPLHHLTADELRHPDNTTLTTDDTLIVWAFPTYAWGVPPVVRRLLRQATLQFAPDARHIAVTTCGDDTGRLAAQWRKDMHHRGLNAGPAYSVTMPNTYVMMKGFDTDTPDIAAAKTAAMPARVHDIAQAITAGNDHDDTTRGNLAALKTAIAYPWFTRYRMSPADYRVRTEACIGCGACAAACPMDNITLDAERHPVWTDDCAFCTACYHACPRHAVEWRNTTLTKHQKT